MSKKRPRTRKRLMFSFFTAIAAVLVLASAAFACTTYKGRFIVQGNGYTEKTAIGKNVSGEMSWCSPVPTAGLPDDNGSAWNVRVKTQPQTGSCAASLPNATYYVDIQKGTGYVGDCMHQSAGNTTLGSFKVVNGYNVNSSGVHDWAYYGFVTTPGEGTICVSDYWYNWGNQMAVDFI